MVLNNGGAVLPPMPIRHLEAVVAHPDYIPTAALTQSQIHLSTKTIIGYPLFDSIPCLMQTGSTGPYGQQAQQAHYRTDA